MIKKTKLSKCCHEIVINPIGNRYVCTSCYKEAKIYSSYNWKIIAASFLTGTLFFIFPVSLNHYIQKHKIQEFSSTRDIPLNKDSIFQALVKHGVYFPELCLAKSLVESGHYKHRKCVDNCNLFGIRYYGQKLAVGPDENGFCIFRSYEDCIKTYKRGQRKFLKNLVEFGYCTDSLYIETIINTK